MTPGSQAACDQGCTCPAMDNAGGRGVRVNGEVMFWINAACPIHGNAPSLAKRAAPGETA